MVCFAGSSRKGAPSVHAQELPIQDRARAQGESVFVRNINVKRYAVCLCMSTWSRHRDGTHTFFHAYTFKAADCNPSCMIGTMGTFMASRVTKASRSAVRRQVKSPLNGRDSMATDVMLVVFIVFVCLDVLTIIALFYHIARCTS